eukprot:gene9123-10070_t
MASWGYGNPDYPNMSLVNKDRIVNLSTEAMQTIEQLDISAEILNHHLDEKTQRIQDEKSGQPSLEEKSEIETIIRVLELIAHQKITLAVKNYDYVDHNIKAVDMEMTMVEKVLKEQGVELSLLDFNAPVAVYPSQIDGGNKKKRKKMVEEGNGNGSFGYGSCGNGRMVGVINHHSLLPADIGGGEGNEVATGHQELSSAEPLYCTCKRIAFGDMIACDNEHCPIEWFHYSCVNLTRKPRNSWICPICSNKKKK